MQAQEEEIIANGDQPIQGSKGYIPFAIAAVVLVLLTLFVAICPPGWCSTSTGQAANASGVLALITASAVGVERILEVFWALMGLSGRPWWPFTSIGYQVQDLVKNLNTTLEPLRDRAQEGLSRVGDAAGRIAEEFPNLQQVNRLTENLDTVTPPNPQAREIADAAKRSAGWFKEHESDLRGAATKVQASAETLISFLDTFKDNPARRLISICLGSIIGVIVAGMLGLDALKATLGTTPPYVVGWFPNAGTAVTGLVIGLGANPTHELIKTLQETKQNRRSA